MHGPADGPSHKGTPRTPRISIRRLVLVPAVSSPCLIAGNPGAARAHSASEATGSDDSAQPRTAASDPSDESPPTSEVNYDYLAITDVPDTHRSLED